MRPSVPFVMSLCLLAASMAFAQTTPTAPAAANPANKPLPVTAPARATTAIPAGTVQTNPAAAPLHPASSAGATERGLAPVEPGRPGVTNQVQDANTNGRDAQGHVLDPHGNPVGQKPAPATTR